MDIKVEGIFCCKQGIQDGTKRNIKFYAITATMQNEITKELVLISSFQLIQ